MSRRVSIFLLLMWSLVETVNGFGTVLHVPGQYGTIQAAMGNLEEGDTVLVEPGVYSESVEAPADLSFAMLGVVDSSGSPDQPVIDPSSVIGSPGLACLTVPQGAAAAVIEHFGFRNGPEMFPRNPPGSVGGIRNGATDLTLRHCFFDSTYSGLYNETGMPSHVEVLECTFTQNPNVCLYGAGVSHVTVNGSVFSGSGDRMVWLGDSARIENCTFFTTQPVGEWLWLIGAGIVVRNCEFGPSSGSPHAVIWSAGSRGWTFEGNVFYDVRTTGGAILFNPVSNDSNNFGGNGFFRNGGVQSASAGGGLVINGQTGWPNVIISGGTFDSCWAADSQGFGALEASQCGVALRENRFRRSSGAAPSVRFFDTESTGIRDCRFDGTGWALWSQDSLDAQMNWWGDSTGPYHASDNPFGLGDTVVGPVDFVPWVTDTSLGVSEPRMMLPEMARIEVHPNPFNAETALRLAVSEPGVYNVDLFNSLGQRVRRLWSGYVSRDKRIAVEGAGLASGIYWVRLSLRDSGKAAAAAKMVVLR